MPPSSSAEAMFKVFVSKFERRLDAAVGAAESDRGMGDAVEVGGFDHGVVGHVVEDDFIADAKLARKGVVADDVAGEAGGAPRR